MDKQKKKPLGRPPRMTPPIKVPRWLGGDASNDAATSAKEEKILMIKECGTLYIVPLVFGVPFLCASPTP